MDIQKKTQDEKIAEGFNQPNNTAQSPLVRSAGAAPQSLGQASVGGPKPASSGQFTNVRNFLGANQGAGERLASKTAEGVQRGVGQATQQVGQFGQKIGQAVGQEEQRVGQADQVRAGIQNIINPGQDQSGMNLMSQGQDFDQARQLITGQTNVNDIIQQKQQLGAQTQSGLTQAGQQVGQLGNESGRFNLLRRAVGGPMYSRGMSGLDNLLMSTEGGATLASAQREAGAQLGQAGSQLGSQIDQFGNRLSDVSTQAQDISKDLQSRLTGGETTINKELNDQLDAAQDQFKLSNEAVNALRRGDFSALTPEQAQQIGLAGQRLNIFDLNLGNFFDTNSAQAPKREDLITDQQAARMNALQALMGQENSLQAGNRQVSEFIPQFKQDEFKKAQQEREDFYLKQVYDHLKGVQQSRGGNWSGSGWALPGTFEEFKAQGGRGTIGSAGNEAYLDVNLLDSLRSGALTGADFRTHGRDDATIRNTAQTSADWYFNQLLNSYKFNNVFNAPDIANLPKIKD